MSLVSEATRWHTLAHPSVNRRSGARSRRTKAHRFSVFRDRQHCRLGLRAQEVAGVDVAKTRSMHSFAREWVVLSVIALWGCEVREHRAEASVPDAGQVAASDSSPSRAAADSGDAGNAGPEPATVVHTRFVVENTGKAPALLGASDCYGRWLSLKQGDEERRWDQTCLCQCGAQMVCTCPGTCPRTQELLMPSLTTEIEWDGIVRDVQLSECYEPVVPAAGTELTAKACWDGLIGSGVEPNCSTTDFKYGEDQVVQLKAAGELAQPHQLSLTLVNETGAPIEYVSERCGRQGWFKLDMGEHSSATAGCPCICSPDKQQASCAACGACAADVTKTLGPGERATLEWDGRFTYTYPSRCTESYIYPTGVFVNGKLCWRKLGETDERCNGLGLLLGEIDSVTVTAQ